MGENIFIKYFDLIKKGEEFDDILTQYLNNINKDRLTFYDLYNFSHLCLGITLSVNLTRDNYISFNIHDYIFSNREVESNYKVLKAHFFKDNLLIDDVNHILGEVKNFYREREKINSN